MNILRRLFGSTSDSADVESDEEPVADERAAVTAWIALSSLDLTNEREEQRVFELENRVIRAVEAASAGIFDTNELVRGSFGMRLLGPDADRLIAVLRPLLAEAPPGSYLSVRRGGSGTSEERVEIGTPAP